MKTTIGSVCFIKDNDEDKFIEGTIWYDEKGNVLKKEFH